VTGLSRPGAAGAGRPFARGELAQMMSMSSSARARPNRVTPLDRPAESPRATRKVLCLSL